MATPLTTPTTQELKEFYPVSASIPDEKRAETANHVKNILFVEMFGYETAMQIADGTINNNDGPTFMGFQKFFALCCAYWEVRDPLVATNFGAKIIDRTGVINPTNNQKGITLIPIEKVITIHYNAAMALLNTSSACSGKDKSNWGGYFSYKTSRL